MLVRMKWLAAKFETGQSNPSLILRQEHCNSMAMDAEKSVLVNPLNCETELNEFCETDWKKMKLT